MTCCPSHFPEFLEELGIPLPYEFEQRLDRSSVQVGRLEPRSESQGPRAQRFLDQLPELFGVQPPGKLTYERIQAIVGERVSLFEFSGQQSRRGRLSDPRFEGNLPMPCEQRLSEDVPTQLVIHRYVGAGAIGGHAKQDTLVLKRGEEAMVPWSPFVTKRPPQVVLVERTSSLIPESGGNNRQRRPNIVRVVSLRSRGQLGDPIAHLIEVAVKQRSQ